MSKANIKKGDIFEIPLSDGRKTYGQYVDDNNGPIVRVFDHFLKSEEKFYFSKINSNKLLFPPVHVGLKDPIRNSMWKIIGNYKIENYIYNGFLSWHPEMQTNKEERVRIKKWFLWDGNKYMPLGGKLPEEYMSYESDAVYSAMLIVKRIETGINPFGFTKKHNKFLTEKELDEVYKKNNTL